MRKYIAAKIEIRELYQLSSAVKNNGKNNLINKSFCVNYYCGGQKT